mmetsp:Transcript_43108/g.67227  ORF Transcript_43108/g.67227 Transcript_43108/m.67227 type:complete len:308 (-) Transcript_43108:23-946(-)
MKFSMAQAKDDSLSFWTLRKQRAHVARDASQSYIGYLQNLLYESGIQYDSFKTFKTYRNEVRLLNLERYSEISNVGNTETSTSIEQHTGHRPFSLTTWVTGAGGSTLQQEVSNPSVMENIVPASEAAVQENVMPKGHPGCRDTHNGVQCQLCCEIFPSKNALHKHLDEVCLRGKLQRSAQSDRAHRRRWKARARKRSVAGGPQSTTLATSLDATTNASGGGCSSPGSVRGTVSLNTRTVRRRAAKVWRKFGGDMKNMTLEDARRLFAKAGQGEPYFDVETRAATGLDFQLAEKTIQMPVLSAQRIAQ